MKKRSSRRKITHGTLCPFCGEADEISVDEGAGRTQTYIEDCPVCCRPRLVHVEPGESPGEVRVWLERGD